MHAKDDIRPGILMFKDAFGDGPAYVKRSKPRGPVRYGDAPPSEINDRLDAIRARLEKLRADVRGRK